MPVRILVVDDSRLTLRLLAERLRAGGYEVTTAQDPREVPERILRDAPDIVIVDVLMPVIDGGSLLRTLRAEEAYAGLQVVLLSALAEPELRAIAEQYHADAWVHKDGAAADRLVTETIPAIVERKRPAAVLTAIVIDDSPTIRRVLADVLAAAGFDVTVAAHGAEALQRLTSGGPADVVLVDVNMPVMGGEQFLAALKDRPRFAAMKRLMVTSESSPEMVTRLLDAGADEYVMKPFSRDAILEKLGILGFPVGPKSAERQAGSAG